MQFTQLSITFHEIIIVNTFSASPCTNHVHRTPEPPVVQPTVDWLQGSSSLEGWPTRPDCQTPPAGPQWYQNLARSGTPGSYTRPMAKLKDIITICSTFKSQVHTVSACVQGLHAHAHSSNMHADLFTYNTLQVVTYNII